MSGGYPIYLFLEHPEWRAIFGISYLAFFAVGMWAASRERKLPRGENRDRGSKGVIYLASFAGIAFAALAPRFFAGARLPVPAAPMFAAAIVLFWLGILTYVWAVVTLGQSFRTSVTLIEGQSLITRGPYRILRHPAYLGGILIFAGIGLGTGNWVALAGTLLLITAGYAFRIRVEERALAERFGAAFAAHQERTWAVIPLVW